MSAVLQSELLKTIMKLTPVERVALMGAIWDSLKEHELPPLTSEQEQELERRIAEHRAHPEDAIPWETVKAELKKRYG